MSTAQGREREVSFHFISLFNFLVLGRSVLGRPVKVCSQRRKPISVNKKTMPGRKSAKEHSSCCLTDFDVFVRVFLRGQEEEEKEER